jgi:type I site-specific restriction-modification system R (restriction) subunit
VALPIPQMKCKRARCRRLSTAHPTTGVYMGKPMRGHALMQAIARVSRVFKDKPGGLAVDYLGLADELKSALKTCAESGGDGELFLSD